MSWSFVYVNMWWKKCCYTNANVALKCRQLRDCESTTDENETNRNTDNQKNVVNKTNKIFWHLGIRLFTHLICRVFIFNVNNCKCYLLNSKIKTIIVKIIWYVSVLCANIKPVLSSQKMIYVNNFIGNISENSRSNKRLSRKCSSSGSRQTTDYRTKAQRIVSMQCMFKNFPKYGIIE